jgi:hypothetical protein
MADEVPEYVVVKYVPNTRPMSGDFVGYASSRKEVNEMIKGECLVYKLDAKVTPKFAADWGRPPGGNK